MKEINYKIEFFSCWHCGSGLAAGADVDVLVIKDKNRLPFVPGKTVKGLVLEALEILFTSDADKEVIKKNMGYFDQKEKFSQGCAFFSNAELSDKEKEAIVSSKVQEYLYRSVASTSIDDDGIAKDHSLRKIEVTVPCTLYGKIIDITDDFSTMIEAGFKMIKRLGLNRNRGLGRCKFSIINEEGGEK